MIIPTTILAGDTFSVETNQPDYPKPTWTITAYFQGPDAITLVSTGTDAVHTLSATAATTAGWGEGTYRYSVVASDGVTQKTIENGITNIQARADLISSSDVRSHNKKMLDAIEALLENRASTDQQSYTIAGRSITKIPMMELLELQKYYADKVRQETARTSTSSSGNVYTIKARM